MQKRQLIVGGGPVGSYAAAHAADALLIDRKKSLGTPVRCTGVLTDAITPYISKKQLEISTMNKIHETIVHIGTSAIQLPISTNYIICNKTFEEQFINKAIDNGQDIRTEHTYIESSGKTHKIKDNKTGKIHEVRAKQLIGADGPKSKVNQTHNIHKYNKHYLGYQIRLKVPEHDNKIHFFPTAGIYGWSVPESENIIRLGICTDKNPQNQFLAFKKRFKGVEIDKQSGFIPLHTPFTRTIRTHKDYKAILVGDAARHIKNTTGGGIIPGIRATHELQRNPSTYKGTPNILRRELYGHFLVHNLLRRCNEEEWRIIQGQAVKHTKILHSYSRDEIIKLLPRLIADPKLLKIGIHKLIQQKISLW